MNILNKFFVLILFSAISIPTSAFAFCGFYVGGAGAEMFADATQVVLLRDGTRTVLSMQNRYQGPLENFAMVIPVSEVIMKEQVKTLSPELFQKIDTLSSPRLVEYWAEDPCYPANNAFTNNGAPQNNGTSGSTNNGVVIEAQFEVGEYEITVLSTTESSALETWLVGNGFALPAGAAAYLEPYVQSGDYFFAAKVNVDKVTFDSEGKAVLSPLRFYMDSEDFELPIRLGMINSNGKQDLIVYILGNDQRYELENYPNVTIPTNIRVVDEVRNDFPAFYRSIFSRTVKENPGAAITEYAWSPSNCDPCPGPVIDVSDLLTFGGDVVADAEQKQWVLTRLHLQYEKDQIGEDLIFKKAGAIVGGREFYLEENKLENGATESDFNNFQARYIIRHPWTGAVDCEDPHSIWGGAQTSTALSPNSTGEDAFSPGAENIDSLIIGNIPELDIEGTGKAPVGTVKTGSNNGQIDGTNNGATGSGGKQTAGCSAVDSGKSFSFGFFLLLGFFLIRRASKKD